MLLIRVVIFGVLGAIAAFLGSRNWRVIAGGFLFGAWVGYALPDQSPFPVSPAG